LSVQRSEAQHLLS